MSRITNALLRFIAVLLIASATAGVEAGGPRAVQANGGTRRASSRFHVEEATIADVHRAIQQGETTCRAVIESYVERARAYNGACTQLVTRDGTPIAPTTGPVRAGAPLSFPTSTMPVASVLPAFEAVPRFAARSRTDGGDAIRSDGASAIRNGRRHRERRSDQRAQHAEPPRRTIGHVQGRVRSRAGRRPAPGELSGIVRCVSTPARRARTRVRTGREVRTASGSRKRCRCTASRCPSRTFTTRPTCARPAAPTSNYAMDAPSKDATVVAELRAKGAIIYAKANLDEYNAGAGDPGGAARPAARGYGAGARSTWGGAACNPYDTTRETGGSSSGQRLASPRTSCNAPSAKRPAARAASRRGATTSSPSSRRKD